MCLDCKVTTEKELDTVEVLKAIQKAKEVKDRKSGGGGGGGKKVRSALLSRGTANGLYIQVIGDMVDVCMQMFFQLNSRLLANSPFGLIVSFLIITLPAYFTGMVPDSWSKHFHNE